MSVELSVTYTVIYCKKYRRFCQFDLSILSGLRSIWYRKAKEILSTNWDFFEKLAAALAEKKLLSAVDIEKIQGECRIIPVAL